MPEQVFFQRAIALHAGHLELARARSASGTGEREAQRAQARARLGDSGPAQFDIRFARRLLARALEQGLERTEPESWLVHPSGLAFTPPHHQRVELGRRHALRRILLALTRARTDQPGVPLSATDLVSAGWPDERIQKNAAANRLRVAMHSLRRMGLERLLITHPDGYLFDPAIAVSLDAE